MNITTLSYIVAWGISVYLFGSGLIGIERKLRDTEKLRKENNSLAQDIEVLRSKLKALDEPTKVTKEKGKKKSAKK